MDAEWHEAVQEGGIDQGIRGTGGREGRQTPQIEPCSLEGAIH